MKKERGKLLNLLLILSLFGLVSSVFVFLNPQSLTQAYGTLPPWYPLYAVISVSFTLVNIYALWQMKKWIVYSLGLSAVISVLMPLFILKPIIQGVASVSVASSIISAAFWFWAIRRKWQYFD